MINIYMPKYDVAIECWGAIAPFIEKAARESNDELDMDVIKDKVAKNAVLIAAIYDDDVMIAAVGFELFTYESGKRVLHILAAGGERVDEWFNQIEQIATELGKAEDCDAVYIIGRKGWERKLKHLGYNHVHTIIGKELK